MNGLAANSTPLWTSAIQMPDSCLESSGRVYRISQSVSGVRYASGDGRQSFSAVAGLLFDGRYSYLGGRSSVRKVRLRLQVRSAVSH